MNLMAAAVFNEPIWVILFYTFSYGALVIALGFVSYIIVGLVYRYRLSKKIIPKNVSKRIKIICLVVWILGFILYLALPIFT
jgi:hypothetical protein